jgi:hypothetical protein
LPASAPSLVLPLQASRVGDHQTRTSPSAPAPLPSLPLALSSVSNEMGIYSSTGNDLIFEMQFEFRFDAGFVDGFLRRQR